MAYYTYKSNQSTKVVQPNGDVFDPYIKETFRRDAEGLTDEPDRIFLWGYLEFWRYFNNFSLALRLNDSFFTRVVAKMREHRIDEFEFLAIAALLFWSTGGILK